MHFTVGAAVLAGFAGAVLMLFWQRRCRRQELEAIAKLTENILNEREITAAAAGEETLYAKIEYQLIRMQEMLHGREEEARKSRDEIQKLISEIAHQMRTPLANIETYLGFLKEESGEM